MSVVQEAEQVINYSFVVHPPVSIPKYFKASPGKRLNLELTPKYILWSLSVYEYA